MTFQVNRASKIPIYKQLAAYIEQGIVDGSFPIDKSLPSERVMAKQFGVNRSTIVAAYDALEMDGLIQRIQGVGTMISKDIWGVTKKRIPSWNRYIEAGSYLPNTPMAQKIRKSTAEDQLINLASGELSKDLMPVTALRNILQTRSFIGSLGYDHPQGNAILRQTVSEHMAKFRHITADAESILITSGSQQALHLVVECLLKRGDAVAIENPSYHYDLQIFKSAGIQTYFLPVGKDGMEPQDLLALHKKHRIRMIFLNPIFQNPTGTLLSLEKRQEVLRISAEQGIPLVEDDPYSLTSFSGEAMQTLKSLDPNGNVLYISSLSKIVASGLRIGWITGPRAVIERLSDAKQQIDFGHASYTQWIANDFLASADFQYHIEILRKELKKRRDCLVSSLERYFGDDVTFIAPEGGIHLWCKLKKSFQEDQLLEACLKRGVIFAPGSTMGTDSRYIRLTFARENEQRIEQGIHYLAEIYNKL